MGTRLHYLRNKLRQSSQTLHLTDQYPGAVTLGIAAQLRVRHVQPPAQRRQFLFVKGYNHIIS